MLVMVSPEELSASRGGNNIFPKYGVLYLADRCARGSVVGISHFLEHKLTG